MSSDGQLPITDLELDLTSARTPARDRPTVRWSACQGGNHRQWVRRPLGSWCAPPDIAAATGREIRWRQQVDIRAIASFGPGEDLTDLAVAAYIAKYATKGAEDAGTLDQALCCRHCKGAGIHEIPEQLEGLRCRPCAGGRPP